MRAFVAFGMIFMDQPLVSSDHLGHNPQSDAAAGEWSLLIREIMIDIVLATIPIHTSNKG